MARDQVINVTVKTVPHPNPKKAIELIANLVIKNYPEELEQHRVAQ